MKCQRAVKEKYYQLQSWMKCHWAVKEKYYQLQSRMKCQRAVKVKLSIVIKNEMSMSSERVAN
jgi:hypothetical protein